MEKFKAAPKEKVNTMALERTPTMSVEEYFELEESDPDTRYEYLDGYVYMMSGGSANQAAISGNIYAILKSLLRGVIEADDEVELVSPGLRFPVIDAYEDVIFDTEGEVVNGN